MTRETATKAQKKVLVLMAQGWELVSYPDTQKQKMMWYLRSKISPYRDVRSNIANNLLTKGFITRKRPYQSNLFELTELGKSIAHRG